MLLELPQSVVDRYVNACLNINRFIGDPKLSAEAKCLLVYVLVVVGNGSSDTDLLCKDLGIDRYKLQNLHVELERLGYVQRIVKKEETLIKEGSVIYGPWKGTT
jgi:hypothetical protein